MIAELNTLKTANHTMGVVRSYKTNRGKGNQLSLLLVIANVKSSVNHNGG